MALPAFDNALRGKQWIKPRVCVLEVRDQKKVDSEPIAWLFVERQESCRIDEKDGKILEASIRLSYEIVESKLSRQSSRNSGNFCGSYRNLGDESLSLVGGGLFFDPPELQGQRIGTYLMNEIVAWAKQQWPEAKVDSINLLPDKTDKESYARRNHYYERFGLEFDYIDSEKRTGQSKPMLVKALIPVNSWKSNIREHDPRTLLARLLYDRKTLETTVSHRTKANKELFETLRKAENRPIYWAVHRLWQRLFSA